MPGLAAILIPALIQEAPQLVAQIIAVFHKQGKVTPEELVAFLESFDPGGGAAFFKPKP